MKIEIKNRYTNKIILCGEYDSVKDCLEKNKNANLSRANLSGANLSGVNLSGVNLSGANLSRADLFGVNLSRADLFGVNLSGANLSGADMKDAYFYGEKLVKEPMQIIGLEYCILITLEHIKIGCECHKVDDWKKFNDKRIIEMDGEDGLKLWKKNKKFIFMCYEKYVRGDERYLLRS